jgi:hypothetical protein
LDFTFVSFNHLTHKDFHTMLELITLALLQLASFSFDSATISAADSSTTTTQSSVGHGVGGWGDDHVASVHGVGGWGDDH